MTTTRTPRIAQRRTQRPRPQARRKRRGYFRKLRALPKRARTVRQAVWHHLLARAETHRATSPASSTPRRKRAQRIPAQHHHGLWAAGLALTVATVALTFALAEFGMWSLATDITACAELVSAGTTWWLGSKHSPHNKPRQAARPYVPGGRCGSTATDDNKPCQNKVRAGASGCHHHGGGGKAKGGAAAATPGKKPKRTGPAAPPTQAPKTP